MLCILIEKLGYLSFYLKFNDSLGQDVWVEDTHDKNEVHEL